MSSEGYCLDKKSPEGLPSGEKEDILYLITIFVVVVYPLEDIVQK